MFVIVLCLIQAAWIIWNETGLSKIGQKLGRMDRTSENFEWFGECL